MSNCKRGNACWVLTDDINMTKGRAELCYISIKTTELRPYKLWLMRKYNLEDESREYYWK